MTKKDYELFANEINRRKNMGINVTEAKEIIGELVKECYTSRIFNIDEHRIAWDLSIEVWTN